MLFLTQLSFINIQVKYSSIFLMGKELNKYVHVFRLCHLRISWHDEILIKELDALRLSAKHYWLPIHVKNL